jgi:hypothetical protein
MSAPTPDQVCGCGAVLTSERKWSEHIAAGCEKAGRSRPETCPHCGGTRVLSDAGPGYVKWSCEGCSRVGTEVVTDAG